ncbi:hypothetical protein [Fundicoccus culcitae]|uniref:Uncharacterized protein n=1 Tax=Fundicoccus culcitae TaxID=2969821 RepID=A0ABY5P3I0_9LACT|nr:hypothetical protein [Fundicoccus culcitae]UUX33222.1 hypothetical protein NRE15_09945 [Fundicoccus culcitae]
MSRVNLYVHYDPVMNYIKTRGIDLKIEDFNNQYVPHNMILSEAHLQFGRFDAPTNFKILRGQPEVLQYLKTVTNQHIHLSNWIDFETIELMHQLTPNEIAEILYLFHSANPLRSAFFYKLQNNYVFLTLPNGLNKTYYRHIRHFHPRLQRVLNTKMGQIVNEGRSFIFPRKMSVAPVPQAIIDKLEYHFIYGLKFDFARAELINKDWQIPLFIIEDELTLLTLAQKNDESIGRLSYNIEVHEWHLEIYAENDEEKLEETQ